MSFASQFCFANRDGKSEDVTASLQNQESMLKVGLAPARDGMMEEMKVLQESLELAQLELKNQQGGQQRVNELEAENDALRTTATKAEGAAAQAKASDQALQAQLKETQAQAQTLLADLEAARKDAQQGKAAVDKREEALRKEVQQAKAAAEEAQGQAIALQAEGDAMRKEVQQGKAAAAERDEALRKVKELEEEQEDLKQHVARSNQKRKDSITSVTRSLSEVSDKLVNAKSSFLPWSEINAAKEKLANIHSAVEKDDFSGTEGKPAAVTSAAGVPDQVAGA